LWFNIFGHILDFGLIDLGKKSNGNSNGKNEDV